MSESATADWSPAIVPIERARHAAAERASKAATRSRDDMPRARRPNIWQRLWRSFGAAARREAAAEAERTLLRVALAEQRSALADAAAQIEELAGRLNRADAARQATEAELTQLRTTVAERERALVDAAGEAQEAASRLARIEAIRAELTAALESGARETEGQRAALAKAVARADATAVRLAEAEALSAEREAALAEAMRRADEANAQLSAFEADRSDLDAALAAARSEIAMLRGALAARVAEAPPTARHDSLPGGLPLQQRLDSDIVGFFDPGQFRLA
jgi:chromosome segregation ATPase